MCAAITRTIRGTRKSTQHLMEHENCDGELTMGRYVLLWLLGVPIPILILIWAFGGLH